MSKVDGFLLAKGQQFPYTTTSRSDIPDCTECHFLGKDNPCRDCMAIGRSKGRCYFQPMRKTINDWSLEYRVHVLDPDGFDRRDPELHTRLFTKEEFERGMIRSTLEFLPGYVHPHRGEQHE